MYIDDEQAAAMSQQPPAISRQLAQALARQQLAQTMGQANMVGLDGRMDPDAPQLPMTGPVPLERPTGPNVQTVSHTNPNASQGTGTGENYYPPAPGSESLGTATSESAYPAMDEDYFPPAPEPHPNPMFNGGPGPDGLSPYGRKAARRSPDLAKALMSRKGGLY